MMNTSSQAGMSFRTSEKKWN